MTILLIYERCGANSWRKRISVDEIDVTLFAGNDLTDPSDRLSLRFTQYLRRLRPLYRQPHDICSFPSHRRRLFLVVLCRAAMQSGNSAHVLAHHLSSLQYLVLVLLALPPSALSVFRPASI